MTHFRFSRPFLAIVMLLFACMSGTTVFAPATNTGTGQYVFTDVPPATYNLIVTKGAFESSKAESPSVAVGIKATAEGAQLQTSNATVGSVISAASLDAPPSLLHDAQTFTELHRGVRPDGSVAGAVVDQSTFMTQITNIEGAFHDAT